MSLRFFDYAGLELARQGRLGRGPGEYQVFSRLVPVGDSAVAVWDVALRRLTIVNEMAQVTSIASPELASNRAVMPRLIGILSDGEAVFLDLVATPDVVDDPVGERRDTMRVVIYSSAPGQDPVLLSVLGDEKVLVRDGAATALRQVFFGLRTLIGVVNETIVVATGDSATIRMFASDGAQIRKSRVEHRPHSVPAADVARARELHAQSRSRSTAGTTINGVPLAVLSQEFAARTADRIPARIHYPPFDSLIAADDGDRILLSRPGYYSLPVSRWRVLDKQLRTVGELELPNDVRIAAVRGLVAAVIRTDNFERERLLLVRLAVSGRSGAMPR